MDHVTETWDPSLNFTNNQYEVRVCPKKPNEQN